MKKHTTKVTLPDGTLITVSIPKLYLYWSEHEDDAIDMLRYFTTDVGCSVSTVTQEISGEKH